MKTLPINQWPNGHLNTGDTGYADGWQTWPGTIETLTFEELQAMEEQRLLIGWSGEYPQMQVGQGPSYIYSVTIGLLRVVRPKSWEITPPVYNWPGNAKQVRRRPLKDFHHYKHGDVRINLRQVTNPIPDNTPVWPYAALVIIPPDLQWFGRDVQLPVALTSGSGIGTSRLRVLDERYLAPWGHRYSDVHELPWNEGQIFNVSEWASRDPIVFPTLP